jgi:serine/threonine-protein kinase
VGIGVLSAAPGLFYYFVVRSSGRSPFGAGLGSGASGATIAVLPFASLGASNDNAYFAEGFHDELLRQMGRIGELRVISRTSVMQYKDGARNLREIAEALGVSSVVEGSVQRAGNRVRVEARLIDARNDLQIWSDRYDRDVTDVFAIQTAVAEEIARTLQTRLSPAQKAQIERKPTQSAEAYDLYLRARDYANRPGRDPNNRAIAVRLYREAIQIDPSFALARAQLARATILRYYQLPETPDAVVEDARAEAQEALRLQPDLAEAHLALGSYYSWRGDQERALQEYGLARSGAPAAAVAAISGLQKMQGRFDDAIRAQYEVVRLDPGSAQALWGLGLSLLWTRRYEEADRVLDRALKIAPDFAAASMIKAVVHEAWKGDTHLAKAVLREARGRLDPQGRVGLQDWVLHLLVHNPGEALPVLDSLESEWISSFAFFPKVYLYAIAHEALGDVARARKEYEMARLAVEATMAKHTGHTSPAGIGTYRAILAHSYAGLGRKEDALREAARAVEIVPYSKDSHWGCYFEVDRAMVEGRVGETDAAIEHIRHLLSIPCLLSPGLLRVDPRWAPLRGDPRFRKLAELE